ncbi:hypothetical protein N826_38845 [Skermanella aerolata KACC 11604]|nr:hypothetical protein N826_38845 [Skermanella aerolata KACC 11604]
MPLSDWRIIHIAISHFPIGNLVEWSGVRVVAVNWKRQPRSAH